MPRWQKLGMALLNKVVQKTKLSNNVNTEIWRSHIFLEGYKNLKDSPNFFVCYLVCWKKKWEVFCKFLWPSQNIWTLLLFQVREQRSSQASESLALIWKWTSNFEQLWTNFARSLLYYILWADFLESAQIEFSWTPCNFEPILNQFWTNF